MKPAVYCASVIVEDLLYSIWDKADKIIKTPDNKVLYLSYACSTITVKIK